MISLIYILSLSFLGLSVLSSGNHLVTVILLWISLVWIFILSLLDFHKAVALQWAKRAFFYLIVWIWVLASFTGMSMDPSPDPNHFLKDSGGFSFLLIGISLLLRPAGIILQQYTKKVPLHYFLLLRKVFWVFGALAVLRHGLSYVQLDAAYFDFTNKTAGDFFLSMAHDALGRADVMIGTFAALLLVILWITSYRSIIAMLKKSWKTVHMLVFPMYLLSILHIAFSGHMDGFQHAVTALIIISRIWADGIIWKKWTYSIRVIAIVSGIAFIATAMGLEYISQENRCTSVRAYTKRCIGGLGEFQQTEQQKNDD
jgi:DMSO/TMAO reductase YedYZ heme-binding membrane subunit